MNTTPNEPRERNFRFGRGVRNSYFMSQYARNNPDLPPRVDDFAGERRKREPFGGGVFEAAAAIRTAEKPPSDRAGSRPACYKCHGEMAMTPICLNCGLIPICSHGNAAYPAPSNDALAVANEQFTEDQLVVFVREALKDGDVYDAKHYVERWAKLRSATLQSQHPLNT